jgi:hypothetical protein
MVSSLREMNDRRQAWMNAKPSYDGIDLRMSKDDVVIGWFVANGDDGDRFIKVYKSHIIAGKSRNGKDMSIPSYCPVSSNDPEVTECSNCAQGHNDIKERMSMYFYVQAILHSQMPQEKQFPITEYAGKRYFGEEVNAFRVWHTSAWKESPWTDIVKLAEMYKGLHNFTFQLDTLGEGINKRFKIYALPQSPALDPTTYEKAKTDLQPITALLLKEMNTPIQAGPASTIVGSAPAFQIGQAAPMSPAPSVTPFAVPGAPVAQFTPGSPAPVDVTLEALTVTETPESDERRPMRKLF